MIPNKSTQIFFVVSCFFFIDLSAENSHTYRDPLIAAAAGGELDRVKFQLELGAEAGLTRDIINQAFLTAAQNGYSAIVKLLLEEGRAVPNVADKRGMTALMHAAQEGHLPVLQELLRVNAETELTNNNGETALFLAVRKGYFDLVNALIEAGANVNHASESGKTSLVVAAQNNYDAIIKLLCNAGATVPPAAVMATLSASARKVIEQNCSWTSWLGSQWENWKSFIGSPFASKPPEQEEDTSFEPSFEEEEDESQEIADNLVVLGLDVSERNPTIIARVYRRLALQHHPDKGGDPEKFREINEAYDNLGKLLNFK